MKRLLYVLKNYSLLGLLILPLSFAHAAKFHVVKKDGTSFSVSKRGKTKNLRAGEYVYFGDEVLVEESSSLSLLGPNDFFVHLNGGSHLQFDFEGFKLLKGSVWLQQRNKRNGEQYLETSNSLVKFYQGDVIVEYSDVKEKTNVFVLNGSALVSNLFDKFKNVGLSGGEFTFVHKDHDEGRPRLATLIGKESFIELRGHFAKVTPLEKGGMIEMYQPKKKNNGNLGELNREIASLDESKIPEVKLQEKVHENHGGSLVITSEMKKKWHLERNPPKLKPKRKIYPKRKIMVYGQGVNKVKQEDVKVKTQRMPASVIEDQSSDFLEAVKPQYNAPIEPMKFKKPIAPAANNPADSFLQQLQQIEESETEVY